MKDSQQRANQLIESGNAHHAEKRYDKAIAAYRGAIRLFPAYASFHLVIGDMLMEMERYMEASIAYRDTLAAHPDHDQAMFNLGLCLLEMAETREGIKTIEKAIKLSGDNFEPLNFDRISLDTLIKCYASINNPETKAIWIDILFETNNPMALEIMHEFLVSAASADGDRLSFRYWMAQAKALTAVGFTSHPEVYEDWRSPNYGAITEDVQKYLANPSKTRGRRKNRWTAARKTDPASTSGVLPQPGGDGWLGRILQTALMVIILPTFFFFTFPILPFRKWIREYEQRPGGKHFIFIFAMINLSIVFSVMGFGIRYYEYGRYIGDYAREGIVVEAEVRGKTLIDSANRGKQSAPVVRFVANDQTITTPVDIMAGGPTGGDTIEIAYLPDDPSGSVIPVYNLEHAYDPIDTWFLINIPLYALAVLTLWILKRKPAPPST